MLARGTRIRMPVFNDRTDLLKDDFIERGTRLWWRLRSDLVDLLVFAQHRSTSFCSAVISLL
jgi:hypothetical protein